MKTLTNIYNVLDNYVKEHEILAPIIFVAVVFWVIFIVTLIVNRKALIQDLDWHD